MAQHVRFVAAHTYYLYIRSPPAIFVMVQVLLRVTCIINTQDSRLLYYIIFYYYYIIIILGLVCRLVVKQALPVTLVHPRVITTTRTPNRVIYPTGRRIYVIFCSRVFPDVFRKTYCVFLDKSINVLMIITMEANKFTRATCSPKKLLLILLLYICDDTNNRNAAKWFFEKIFGKFIFQMMFLC